MATNVNSFAIHDEFLLVTTLAHQLHCIELRSLLAPGELSLGVGRAVERGSRLVCACAGSTRVVLQMPRGNLEAIDPRPLVLNALKRLIDRRQYLEALMLMKRHRINMNLLYDHDPQVCFMRNLAVYSLHYFRNWPNTWPSLSDRSATLYCSTYF